MQTLKRTLIEQSLTYEAYAQHNEDLLAQYHHRNPDSVDDLIHSTRINLISMERLDKTARMMAITRVQMAKAAPMTWLVLTESWCNDAAQVLPVLNKMSKLNDKIVYRILFRDENPKLMDAFLTKGTRSIPKLILLDSESLKVLGQWGPRPAALQAFVLEELAKIAEIKDLNANKKRWDELHTQVQRWYAKDKSYSVQQEILAEIGKASLLIV
jgi:hypothetical protein